MKAGGWNIARRFRLDRSKLRGNTMMRVMVLALILALAGCDQAAENEQIPDTKTATPSGRITKYGIWELVKAGRLRDTPGTTTGKSIEKPTIRIVQQTDQIPMELNTYFAYQYRISNLPDNLRVKFRRVLIHPEMTLPDGSKTTGSDFMIPGKVQRNEVFGSDGYALTEDYELVDGTWTFQLWYEGKMMTEQIFTVFNTDRPAENTENSGG